MEDVVVSVTCNVGAAGGTIELSLLIRAKVHNYIINILTKFHAYI